MFLTRKDARQNGHADVRAHQVMVGPAGRNEGSPLIAFPIFSAKRNFLRAAIAVASDGETFRDWLPVRAEAAAAQQHRKEEAR